MSRNLGRLIAVVGPSGVGKDSVLTGLQAACPSLHLVRRVISRPETVGGEHFKSVSESGFAEMRAAGVFTLYWYAHGLAYGIPQSVNTQLSAGTDCLVNLSRSVLMQAQASFDPLIILNLTAPKDTLADRLLARGRENADQIQDRLQRATAPIPDGLDTMTTIANDAPIEKTIQQILTQIYPVREYR
ncbi:MAG: phosphonate metabolism protein/1,5-bisphosphokinase (PRPP-forming) PhnN [Pseudoruegeria sp.]